MEQDFAGPLFVVGRVLLAALFVAGGIKHVFIAPLLTGMIAARGLPQAKAVLYFGTAFQIVFGTLFMFGIAVVASAFALVGFTIAASLMLLDFWNKEGQQREAEKNQVLTNAAVIGGLLVTAATAM
jgi:putative oxidoreductase